MSDEKHMVEPSYYQVLQLPLSDGSIEPANLKIAYHRALLAHHPDKNITGAAETSTRYSVDQINEAYKTLSNVVKKAVYDRDLRKNNKRQSPGLETGFHSGVEIHDLEELSYDAGSNVWSRGCRCGDESAYTLTDQDLEIESEHGEIYVACRSCSLFIRVLFNTDGAIAEPGDVSQNN